MKRICVFCGSSRGIQPAYAQAAAQLGSELAGRGLTLVYGGGRIGLMGVLADAMLAAGGEVIGVIPQSLASVELAHAGLTDLRVVHSMHQRKALMADLADAFVALPGGYGTFEEFCEILTWAQLGIHHKPCGLLNVKGYYNNLLSLFNHAAAEQFLNPAHRALVLEDTDPGSLLDRLAHYQAPLLPSKIDIEET